MDEECKYQFKFVLIRYVPDFFRQEFLNVGLILYDMTSQSIMSRFIDNPSRMKCINPATKFKIAQTYSKNLINFLKETVRKAKETGDNVMIGKTIEDAFSQSVIPGTGLISFSNVKSGLTNDINKEFNDLYARFIKVKGDREESAIISQRSLVKEIYRILAGFGDNLIKKAEERSFYYPVTNGQYKCEVAFNGKDNLNLKVLSLRSQANYPSEIQNILSAITILSDLKKENRGQRFGGLMYFSPKYNKKAQELEFGRIEKRFTESQLECVKAEADVMLKYFKTQKLAR